MNDQWRHRETGTRARIVGNRVTPEGLQVSLQCLENPLRHYEAAFPFTTTVDAIDVGGPGLHSYVPGRVSTDLLTITEDDLHADWEPVE